MLEMASKKEIQEIKSKIVLPKEVVEQILNNITKPTLSNIHCRFDDEMGVGTSDKST